MIECFGTTEIALGIVDDLFRKGDEAFPFIRLLSHKPVGVQDHAEAG